jgi:DNA-directed RNA polymerase subunit E'/Rpb7
MLEIIEQKISVDPFHLDNQLKNHILSKLKKQLEGSCHPDYGYILKVGRLIKLGDNTISPATSRATFTVKYEIESLKPRAGLNLRSTVCLVFQHGLLFNFMDKINVLVPLNQLGEYKFNNTCFVHKDSDHKIQTGDVVNVSITNTKFENNKFSCIGRLVKQ